MTAGLKVPRYDRLQDTMSSLVDNLSTFNWRELVVRLRRMGCPGLVRLIMAARVHITVSTSRSPPTCGLARCRRVGGRPPLSCCHFRTPKLVCGGPIQPRLHLLSQMGLSWLILLEFCKFVGRKHRRLIYVRAVGPLLVHTSCQSN